MKCLIDVIFTYSECLRLFNTTRNLIIIQIVCKRNFTLRLRANWEKGRAILRTEEFEPPEREDPLALSNKFSDDWPKLRQPSYSCAIYVYIYIFKQALIFIISLKIIYSSI